MFKNVIAIGHYSRWYGRWASNVQICASPPMTLCKCSKHYSL
ncbi:hypothetical protein HMPREF0208_00855 [Citrobacter koseri]|nr:hypothetical protein HMPREF3220_00299 [Citrobacter koseri]KXA04947.1 hypothetical protein HMPREF3207_01140 [Citrobacter koseri]KXB46180.1 hypothetical protein HMPREF0208_00855 [Citrobacter koseri]